MKSDYYERKINDIISKCPIEAGVEILVYMLLDEIVNSLDISLVDINRIWKDSDMRLTTDAGISDIAVLSSDFQYQSEVGEVYGFIEVKATSVSLDETEQISGQMKEVENYIFTNGLVWRIYKKGLMKKEIILFKYNNKNVYKVLKRCEVNIEKEQFETLLGEIHIDESKS